MPLAASDIVQATFRYRFAGQEMIWVMNYRIFSTSSTQSVIEDLGTIGDKLKTTTTPNLLFYWLRVIPTNVVLHEVRTQRVRPTRSIFVQRLVNEPGTNAGGNASASNIAAVTTRKTELGGRKDISNSHIGPIGPTQIVDGKLTAAFLVIMTDLAAAMSEDQFIATPSISLRPVVLHKLGAVPPWGDVAVFSVGDTGRVMRRRTVGVGI